jgi:CBS domain-containing protein
MRIEEIMTPEPVCCYATDTVQTAATIMREMDCGVVPVLENETSKRVVGIVTDRDLAIRSDAEGRDPSTMKVSECMSTDLVCCRPQDDVVTVLDMMKANQVRRVPVVDAQNHVVGIVATADMVLCGELPAEEIDETMHDLSEPHMESIDAFTGMSMDSDILDRDLHEKLGSAADLRYDLAEEEQLPYDLGSEAVAGDRRGDERQARIDKELSDIEDMGWQGDHDPYPDIRGKDR